MAKKKKRTAAAKARRAALKGFAAKGEAGFPGRIQSEKAELVYNQGKNHSAGPGDTYANINAGAAAANSAGYAFIYMNGILYTTAGGRARAATTEQAGTVLEKTTAEPAV